jgi:hypothetical protein
MAPNHTARSLCVKARVSIARLNRIRGAGLHRAAGRILVQLDNYIKERT